MKRYIVSIHGSNLLINLRGEKGKYGFRTTRYVEAEHADQAERRSLRLIFNDPDLHRIILNGPEDPPEVEAEEIRETDHPVEDQDKALKLNYYREDDGQG